MENDPHSKARALAQEVLSLARSTLLADLRFLSPALCRLELCEDPQHLFATDGQRLYYGYVDVLRRWQADRASVLRRYLHAVLHCLFCHPFVGDGIDPLLWDLACDIATEAAIDELSLPCVQVERHEEASETLAVLSRALNGHLTAERIYRHYADQPLSGPQLEALRAPFLRDEHDLWYARSSSESGEKPQEAEDQERGGDEGGGSGDTRQGEAKEEQRGGGAQTQTGAQQAQGKPQADAGNAKAEWQKLAAQTQTDLETHSRRWSDRAGSLLLSLREGRRVLLDYADFLRRFAVLTEVPKLDPDSFDVIFYTYGMQLYGNLPLIEPLETCESLRIRDFVIVIDTSASVQGEQVRAFLDHTCRILLEQDAFGAQMALHILECDAQVQRDTLIRNADELATYLQTPQLHGAGGTDFRPAFSHIERLLFSGEMTDLRGILYFTDGQGIYPKAPPPCETAFLFVSREDAGAKVPSWAIRVLLDERTLTRPQILYAKD